MKRFVKCVCLLMAVLMIMAVPANAADPAAPWSSNYFTKISAYLYHVSDTTFQVWFDVTAVRGMDQLGTSVIEIQRSTDGTNWTTVSTYTKENYYSTMICEDTSYHSNYVTFYGSASYTYRARVTFYAKDGLGTAEVSRYTGTLSF